MSGVHGRGRVKNKNNFVSPEFNNYKDILKKSLFPDYGNKKAWDSRRVERTESLTHSGKFWCAPLANLKTMTMKKMSFKLLRHTQAQLKVCVS